MPRHIQLQCIYLSQNKICAMFLWIVSHDSLLQLSIESSPAENGSSDDCRDGRDRGHGGQRVRSRICWRSYRRLCCVLFSAGSVSVPADQCSAVHEYIWLYAVSWAGVVGLHRKRKSPCRKRVRGGRTRLHRWVEFYCRFNCDILLRIWFQVRRSSCLLRTQCADRI